MFSNDFTIRMLGLLMPQIPENKSDINDIELNNILRKLGSYQVFIDISRCSSLTSLPCKVFNTCTNLLYLDISYTKLNDISTICEYCTSLKGLNISAINMIEINIYQRLKNLEYLQILQMRNSNVKELDFIIYLKQLRSLDLGGTCIQSIEPLNTCTRLEELLLDNISLINNDYIKLINTFKSLKSLSILNICESQLYDLNEDIKTNLPNEIIFETTAKRTQFFEYIATNNYIEMNYLLSSGIDVDISIQIEDELMLLKLWRNRCTTNKIKGPFFQCSKIEERYRPTGLHFAIVFNSLECMQLLLYHGANTTRTVWFSDVKESKDEPENTASTQEKKIFTGRQLIDIVFKRNLHRLTENMITHKIPNWKKITTNYYKRLVYCYDTKKNKNELLSLDIIDMKIKKLEEYSQLQAVKDTMEEEEEGLENDCMDELGTIDTISLDDSILKSSNTVISSNKSIKNNTDSNNITIINNNSISDIKDNTNNIGNSNENNIKKNRQKRFEEIIPRLNRIITWRNHSLVHKINDKPLILNISVDIQNHNINNKKDINSILQNNNNDINNLKSKTTENYIGVRRKSSIMIPKTNVLNITTDLQNLSPDKNKIITTSSSNELQQQLNKPQRRRSSINSINTYDSNDSNTNDKMNWIGDDVLKLKELKEVPLLGKKSYWLERRGQLINEREEKYNKSLIEKECVDKQGFKMNNLYTIKNNYYNSLSLKMIPTTSRNKEQFDEQEQKDKDINKSDVEVSTSFIPKSKKSMIERKAKFLKDLTKRLDVIND